MIRNLAGYVMTFVLLLSVVSGAQNLLNGPESVAFDTANNRCLVSNVYGGAIIAIDENGDHSYFKTGLGSCLGNQIKDNIVYVSVPDGIMGFDLTTADTVLDLAIPCWGHTDGLAADTSGFLYVVDTGGRIIKIDLSDSTFSPYVSSTLPGVLQDITFDEVNNRLLAVGFAAGAPIVGVNLIDGSRDILVQTPFGMSDGVAIDQFGNTYATSYSSNGQVYRYGPDFTNPPELISSGHNGPAGIEYNRQENILGVPNFYANTVSFLPITPQSVWGLTLPTEFIAIKNYPNPFNARTVIEYQLPHVSDVSLNIYDNLGRLIETINQGIQLAGGHNLVWNGNGNTSGTYYYVINTGDRSVSGKMILLK